MTLAVAATVAANARPSSGESQHVAFLARHFRLWYAVVEREIRDALARLSRRDYHGRWRGHDLANGGCFLAPAEGTFRVETRHGPANVDAETAGIVATLIALQALAEEHPTKQVFATRVRQLREHASRHLHAATVFNAID